MVSHLTLTLVIACLGIAAGQTRCKYPDYSKEQKYIDIYTPKDKKSESCQVCVKTVNKIIQKNEEMKVEDEINLFDLPHPCRVVRHVNQKICKDVIPEIRSADALGYFDTNVICRSAGYCLHKFKDYTGMDYRKEYSPFLPHTVIYPSGNDQEEENIDQEIENGLGPNRRNCDVCKEVMNDARRNTENRKKILIPFSLMKLCWSYPSPKRSRCFTLILMKLEALVQDLSQKKSSQAICSYTLNQCSVFYCRPCILFLERYVYDEDTDEKEACFNEPEAGICARSIKEKKLALLNDANVFPSERAEVRRMICENNHLCPYEQKPLL